MSDVAKDLCIPTDRLVRVRVAHKGGAFLATFSWNGGELDSGEDYETPIEGRGASEEAAVGRLILAYDAFRRLAAEGRLP